MTEEVYTLTSMDDKVLATAASEQAILELVKNQPDNLEFKCIFPGGSVKFTDSYIWTVWKLTAPDGRVVAIRRCPALENKVGLDFVSKTGKETSMTLSLEAAWALFSVLSNALGDADYVDFTKEVSNEVQG